MGNFKGDFDPNAHPQVDDTRALQNGDPNLHDYITTGADPKGAYSGKPTAVTMRQQYIDSARKLGIDLETPDLSQGAKFDQGKNRLDLLPVDSLKEIAKVLTFGAQKYADRNWEKGIQYGRLYRAALGHLMDWHHLKTPDDETGLSHLAHAGCCIMFLLAFEQRGMSEFDNRPDYGVKENDSN